MSVKFKQWTSGSVRNVPFYTDWKTKDVVDIYSVNLKVRVTF
jgi:hypothetical protein